MKRFPTHIVSVFGVVENAEEQILLLKHRQKGTWMFPGGQVENGENLIDALLRETMEESGMEITVGKLFSVSSGTRSYKGYNGYRVVPTMVILGFACTWLSGEFRPSNETSEGRWFKKGQALELLTGPLQEKFGDYLMNDGVQYLEYVTRPDYELKLKREI